MNQRLHWLLVLFLAGVMNPPPATACNIPVFRYALERWRADRDEDRYEAVVFQRGPLAAEHQRMVALLRPSIKGRGASANLLIETVDLSGPMEPSIRQLWHSQNDANAPWMVVRSPKSDEERRTIWAGSLEMNAAYTLLDSPARRDIARRLMKGDSIVWLLLERAATGNEMKPPLPRSRLNCDGWKKRCDCPIRRGMIPSRCSRTCRYNWSSRPCA